MEAKLIDSIHEFAEACRTLERKVPFKDDAVYDLWMDGITDRLRDEIYSTFWTLADNPEPARSALRQLGARYVVDSLMNY